MKIKACSQHPRQSVVKLTSLTESSMSKSSANRLSSGGTIQRFYEDRLITNQLLRTWLWLGLNNCCEPLKDGGSGAGGLPRGRTLLEQQHSMVSAALRWFRCIRGCSRPHLTHKLRRHPRGPSGSGLREGVERHQDQKCWSRSSL